MLQNRFRHRGVKKNLLSLSGIELQSYSLYSVTILTELSPRIFSSGCLGSISFNDFRGRGSSPFRL
jgi:hypothetical protein